MKYISIFLFAALLTCLQFNGKAQDESIFFRIKGEVVPESGERLKTKLMVFEDNKTVDYLMVNRNGKFKLWLEADHFYTLEFKAPNHTTKRVTISTQGVSSAEMFPDDYVFNFEVYLFDEENFEGKNTDLMDYPSAWVYYDQEYRRLLVNKEYTESVYIAQSELAKAKIVEGLIADK